MNVKKVFMLFVLLAALILSACSLIPSQNSSVTEDFSAIYTQAAATVVAQMTQIAQESTPLPTLVFPTATSDIPVPTATQQGPAPTTAPPATSMPTSTPLPTWTPTSVPLPCNWLQYISDVTVPDNTLFTPGASFVKIWKIKNIGTCTWTKDYDLVFSSGTRMDGTNAVALPDFVLPGETVEVAVRLTAPEKAGTYKGFWQLRNAQNVLFGLGLNANTPFWVQIKVVEVNEDYVLDFANTYCMADWESSTKDVLPCPGSVKDDDDGFVALLNNPHLESRNENEPALWVRPNDSKGGWISGTYPEIRVKDNYHFITWVGCLVDNEGCDVTFFLEYQIDGGRVQKLGEWHEVYDNQLTKVSVDLSSLAGEDVNFILTVEVNNKKTDKANAFWFVPRIEKITQTDTN